MNLPILRDEPAHARDAGGKVTAGTDPVTDLARRLAPPELRVVTLARTDGLESLRDRPRRGLIARLLFGPLPPSQQLANARLEALRRLAVQAWHKGFLLPASALEAAQRAGFSEDQVGAVVDTIGRARGLKSPRPC